MSKIKSYRDLLIWSKSKALCVLVYQNTNGFPKEEQFGLTSQMRRASVSVPSNIAEGYGRNSTNDFIRYLKISLGSLYELQTQIDISLELKYLITDSAKLLLSNCLEIEKMLNSFIAKLSKGRN